jgi:hypothetical protein
LKSGAFEPWVNWIPLVKAHLDVALQVAFERQTLKPVSSLYRL